MTPIPKLIGGEIAIMPMKRFRGDPRGAEKFAGS